MPAPDFLVIGAPKAGTTALHGALARHPEVFMSGVKEPKFFLCGGRPDRPRGPGDAHSVKEWIWEPKRYEALFADAAGRLRGESTPFYLYDRAAHRRMHARVPGAKLIAVVRDPIDRAHSNWLHLWADGLEPVGDFVTACGLEPRRTVAGWGYFWRYLELGKYGRQFRDLLEVYPRSQVHVLRYRELVDTPADALDRICRFLGVREGVLSEIPMANSRGFVPDSWRRRVMAGTARAGAEVGRLFPPRLWRKASVPLLRALQHGAGPRPELTVEERRFLLEGFEEDVALLGELTGEDFGDWLGERGRGEFWARSQAVGDGRAAPAEIKGPRAG